MAIENGAVLRDGRPLSLGELSNSRIEEWLSFAVYDNLVDGQQYTVNGTVSFDNGHSWHGLLPLRLTPRKLL
ncbi:hypothetical protein D3C76_1837240 [compost metagenome]